MVKVFRKLRLRDIEKGRIGRYFLYAIGEIVLVVIGIFIALQLNLVSETKKRENRGMEILKEIRISLIQDTLAMASSVEAMSGSKRAIKVLLNSPIWGEDLPTEMFRATNGVLLTSQKSAFEQLKSAGFEYIGNDSLRSLILEYYDYEVPEVEMRLEANLNQFNETELIPLLYREFNLAPIDTSMTEYDLIPKDYVSLANDPNYASVLSFKYIFFDQEQANLIRLKNSARDLLAAIERELS